MNDAIRTDTIVAIASAPGAGGVGLLRLSGSRAAAIARALGAPALRPRHAHYARLRDADGDVIDDGIVLWFPAPNSFTGEEVVELQGTVARYCCSNWSRAALRSVRARRGG